ncbi:alpha/beta fold hydrolase [Sphingosinicellaceae bacterium]|nr:alpha/beta fold hydrolase [Sphingosinicellaceae bacterium]
MLISLIAAVVAAAAPATTAPASPGPAPAATSKWPITEADFTVRNFAFASGETLPELRLHYTTLGKPHRDAKGRIDNAVMVLHGTGGTGKQFLQPQFADRLYGPGQPLDITRTYVILPDGIGHGKSSKPSDGLHARFPHYDYTDMVAANHALVVDGLKIPQLRLVMGTSMGCMHAFVMGEAYPGFARALMPLACLPVEIAGRNRMWRKLSIDAIKADPAYANGDYIRQPVEGMRTATALTLVAGGAPVRMQADMPTRAAVETWLDGRVETRLADGDANDTIYQLDASRTYDPSAKLASITVPVAWINSGDDFINPPGLHIAEAMVGKMPNATFRLIPESAATHGHGTHTWAQFWSDDLVALLRRSE